MDSNAISEPILIVGGCGFLGHHLVNEVFTTIPGGPVVAVLDLVTDRNRHSSGTYYTANIACRDEVARVFDLVKPQLVLHTVSPKPFEVDRSLFEKVNIVGTQNLIDCAKAVGSVRAFVYTASASLVDNGRGPMVEVTEEYPVLFYPDQPEMYSHSKAVAEKIVLTANRADGMLTASIRAAALYGVGDGILTTNITNQVLSGRAKYRFGTDPYLYDILYVGNYTNAQMLVTRALVQAAKSAPLPADIKVEGEAFLVTNDEHIPFWDLQSLVADVAGVPIKDEDVRCIPVWFIRTIAFFSEWIYWIFSLGRKQPMITRWVVRLTTRERTICIDKVKKKLGYKPRFTNREGWARALEWALPTLKASMKAKLT